MQRRSIPAILEEIGALLEIEGDNPFRAKAYHNAAKVLAGLDDLDSHHSAGAPQGDQGHRGNALRRRSPSIYETGKIAFHEELKRRSP